MFESNPSFQPSDNDTDLSTPDSLESILLSSCLPKFVKTAPFSRAFEREMDAEEILRVTEPSQVHQSDPGYMERLRVRREALTLYSGSILTCILIRLPGVVYTIEIDPVSKSVVHWEWQGV